MIQNTITTDIDIASGGGKYSGSSTLTPALTINNAQKSDSANYQCTATNVVGTSSSQESFLNVFGNVPVVQIPASTYSVDFGGNVIIPCSIQANPLHTSVQWKRFYQGVLQNIDIANSGGKYSGSTLNSPDLVINNAVSADETNYICTATNAIGTGQSFSSFLDVIGGLLTVSIPSNQYSVPASQDIQLVCKVTGTPAATSVLWKKITVGRSVTQDINVASSNGHYSGATVATPSLTIHNAGETDNANYICTATNAAGVAQSQTTNLNVIGDIPTVVILNPPYTVSYGETITIQCQVTATPSANNIIWTKTINGVDTLINVASSNGKYSGSTVDSPSLTITNANIKNDEGNYVCSATNSLGTGQSASVFLDVIGGLLTVSVPQAKYTVQQGSSIQMICSWSGTPSATAVVWKKYIQGVPTDISVSNGNGKYGGSTVTSPSLTINNADQSDKATYVCTATNAEGTSNSQPVNLEVTGGVPVVRVKQSVYTVNHGSFVILECTVTANPTHTTVQWYRIVNGNPVSVDISKSDKYSGSTVSNPSLTVLSATNADEGNYVCSATNSVGTSQSSQTFLDVLGDILTVIIPQSQYQNDFGTNATLTCLVTGSPAATNVYWTKSHAGGTSTNIDMTNTNKYSGSSVNNPSLVISNVGTNDEGDYVCWATNAVGTAQSSSTNLIISGSK
ncbi:hemicentin-1-like [Mytilus californianus]|uniref:hemicentin-1-like n=1 Tax=Mytilus californianus TaxID=6549 RepID=UPI002246C86C|nr:hemicentin-1-like [Mytilus californianus]